jgi:hypothetical protein
MRFPKFIEINGAGIAWRDVMRLRRDQRKATHQSQPTLFELETDCRPPSQQTADGRFQEPALFDGGRP